MELLITLTTIYILSVWRMWWWIRMATYHPRGRYTDCDITTSDYVATFTPILNIIMTILTFTIESWLKDNTDHNIFKPNKPLK